MNDLDLMRFGIHVIDTGFGRPLFDASYLLVERGRAAFIDTGPNAAVPRLLAALQTAGLERSAVDYVIATHVHLDHAGGVGALMRELPQAQLVIHPRGARHMIDPTALMQGVRAVYGDDVAARDYGELVPVDAQRVIETSDGMTLELAGRPLLFIDTPGHARHHHCIWDERSRGWFTGDTFGVAYPSLVTPGGQYILPTTSPVQFDPAALRHSVARLLERKPVRMYLTHYGAVENPERLAVQLLAQVDAMVDAARAVANTPQRHVHLKDVFRALYIDALRQMGATAPDPQLAALLATDIELNAQGVGVWLDNQARDTHKTNTSSQ
ncbi:MAG TPA: MBL fold metallo-hydrolase [Steroidobacteraceae bacterium]|nr:MBL fold metallo-hydrolase [Steroidobacteraceae bacterium]